MLFSPLGIEQGTKYHCEQLVTYGNSNLLVADR